MDPKTVALACLFLGYDACGIDGHFSKWKSLSSANLIFDYANQIRNISNKILEQCAGWIFEDSYNFLGTVNISFIAFRSNLAIPFTLKNIEDFLSESP